jgi:hypothetical protein
LRKYHLLFSLIFIALLSGCDKWRNAGSLSFTGENRTAVARVKDKFLYADEIQGLAAKGLSREDSIDIIERFTDAWVRRQVFLSKAGEFGDMNETEIERKLEDYKQTLVAYEFQKRYIARNLDTLVSETQLQDYYQKNSESFVLKHTVMRGRYLKVPVDAPGAEKLNSLFRSEREEDIAELTSYASRFAQEYFLDTHEWHDFDAIVKKAPALESALSGSGKFIIARDNQFQYLLLLKETRSKGAKAPLSFVKGQIRNSILNNRKVKMINTLEDEVYNEAKKNNEFDIYGQS